MEINEENCKSFGNGRKDTQANIKSLWKYENWSPWERKATNVWAKANIQHYLISCISKCESYNGRTTYIVNS